MPIIQEMQHYFQSSCFELLRLAAWMLLLIILFIPLERGFARRPHRAIRQNFLTDLGYFFINGLIPKAILTILLSATAYTVHYLALDDAHTFFSDLPSWSRVIAALVVGELGAYWGHRLMHSVPFLWRFHAVHHSAEELDWLVNTRAHPVDIVFTRFCGLSPMYLLGLAQPTATNVDFVPMLVVISGTVWGFFIHSNVNLRFSWVECIVSTPYFHHWHHSRDRIGKGHKNFAAILPVVDLLFGTLYLPGRNWPIRYGSDTAVPRGIMSQLLKPFRRL